MNQQSEQADSAASGVVITSGPAKVVASGSVINFKGNPLRISVQELDFDLVFEFMDEETSDESRIRITPDRGDARLTLINFKSTLGSGLKEPIHLGTSENRDVYLQLRVYAAGSAPDKLLHYTVYLAEPGA